MGAHCRRRLREIYDSSGQEIAAEGLHRIAELYAIEADIRSSAPEWRLAERQNRSAPLVQAFGDWMKQQHAHVLLKSQFGTSSHRQAKGRVPARNGLGSAYGPAPAERRQALAEPRADSRIGRRPIVPGFWPRRALRPPGR